MQSAKGCSQVMPFQLPRRFIADAGFLYRRVVRHFRHRDIPPRFVARYAHLALSLDDNDARAVERLGRLERRLELAAKSTATGAPSNWPVAVERQR